jgi:NADP-dependent 3-hydroxy acid dehydrogenase YdfG
MTKLTALVTGASAGFGSAICRRCAFSPFCTETLPLCSMLSFLSLLSFVNDGHRVIAAGRRTERLLSLQDELGGPEKCHVLTLDVRDRAATEALVASLPPAWQTIDVAVNVRAVQTRPVLAPMVSHAP